MTYREARDARGIGGNAYGEQGRGGSVSHQTRTFLTTQRRHHLTLQQFPPTSTPGCCLGLKCLQLQLSTLCPRSPPRASLRLGLQLGEPDKLHLYLSWAWTDVNPKPPADS